MYKPLTASVIAIFMIFSFVGGITGCQSLMESMKESREESRERHQRTKEYIKMHGDYATVFVGDVPLGVYAPAAIYEKIKLRETLVLSPQFRDPNGQWHRSRPTWRLRGGEQIVAVTRTMDGLILVRGLSKGKTGIVFNDPAVDDLYPDLNAWQQDESQTYREKGHLFRET